MSIARPVPAAVAPEREALAGLVERVTFHSPETGFWALFVYFFVQTVDGYLIMPYVARRTVDLAVIGGGPAGAASEHLVEPCHEEHGHHRQEDDAKAAVHVLPMCARASGLVNAWRNGR